MAYIHVETKEKLYAKAYKAFEGSISGSFTVNIRTKYPTVDYTQLTNNDFVCSYLGDSDHQEGTSKVGRKGTSYYMNCNSMAINHSYNASTGVLTVSPSTMSCASYKDPDGTGSRSFSGLRCAVYMIVDGVREEYVK